MQKMWMFQFKKGILFFVRIHKNTGKYPKCEIVSLFSHCLTLSSPGGGGFHPPKSNFLITRNFCVILGPKTFWQFLVISYGHFKTKIRFLGLSVSFWRPFEKLPLEFSLYKILKFRFFRLWSIMKMALRCLFLIFGWWIFACHPLLYVSLGGPNQNSSYQGKRGFS